MPGCASSLADAERKIDDVPAFTRSAREFHLAVAEASHNRVLVVQLISLQHVSWPSQNPTLTPQVARRMLDVHKELAALIEMRDGAGARRLMDDHVKMIAARRVAEHRDKAAARNATAAESRKPTSSTETTTRGEHMAKEKFIIEPHFRLQEWVAEEKGYFKDEGLDYIFHELIKSTDGAHHYKGDKVGAMQSFEHGRTSDVSCACHWTVGVAASKGKGRLYGDVYSVSPAGVFVPKDSPVQKPEDLAGVPIAVGYQSGSHYSTIQALEQYMPADKINLTFADGMLFHRLDQLLDGKAQASTLFCGPVLLRRAARLPQDHRLHLHDRHLDHRAIPTRRTCASSSGRCAARSATSTCGRSSTPTTTRTNSRSAITRMMDTRRWGPGERLVFEPYTKEVYEETFKWIADHGIFADTGMGSGKYEEAVLRLS